jgi:(5-formylfuran-3-yl)methyl phosphate synthase
MELLVSVRSGAEVEAALSGGAHIIDAKEPSRGSLGPVSSEALTDILAQVPGEHALSLALGDFAVPDEVVSAFSSRELPSRVGPLYLKLGFAGTSAPDRIESMITTAVTASRQQPAAPVVVVVAYADSARAETVRADTIIHIAAQCGAAGVLLDTQVKDGRGLFRWMDVPAVQRWVERGRSAGLLTAVAGGLQLDDIGLVSAANPDVVGFRGAACDCGRNGTVNLDRVRALRHSLAGPSGFVQAASIAGETRDPGAISSYDELG